MIEIENHYLGRRVKLFGYRIHHGLVGLFLVGLGLVLAAHDWADRHLWMRGRDG